MARGVAWRLWERVQSELAARDWTNSDFQRRTGVSRTTLDRLATSPRTPRRQTVKTIANVFDIDLAEALRLAGIVPDEPSAEQLADRWADRLAGLTPEDRDRLLRAIDTEDGRRFVSGILRTWDDMHSGRDAVS